MCGIYALLTNTPTIISGNTIEITTNKGVEDCSDRGPEGSKCVVIKNKENEYGCGLGFARLAINGLTEQGMQPFSTTGFEDTGYGLSMICNGEIYNAQSLYDELKQKMPSDEIDIPMGSDCSIILMLYKYYGIEYTVNKLDGVFAFILVDSVENKAYAVRDRLGVRPLYWGYTDCNPIYRATNEGPTTTYCFGSNMRQVFNSFNNDPINRYINNRPYISWNIQSVNPGTIVEIDLTDCYFKQRNYWSIYSLSHNFNNDTNNPYQMIASSLEDAVTKRVTTTERPYCCLLSGGLDSSIIAALVNKAHKTLCDNEYLETYSIGIEGSEDLKYARMVSGYIGTKHTEVIVTVQDMIDAIPEVVKNVESYDTTTIRASVGNYLVAKYIKEHSKARVVFNGDGADELMGGYLYFNVIKNEGMHERERMRLLDEISHYDVLRSDKCISSNGLEPRTPFLDSNFVTLYTSIIHSLPSNQICEKYHMRKCIEKCFQSPFGGLILPKEVLWRKKEAFSDGVSGIKRSWSEEIQFWLVENKIAQRNNIANIIEDSPSITVEQAFYKALFNKYLNCKNDIRFDKEYLKRLNTRWMPRFVNSNDPSARTLDFYLTNV